MRTYSGWNLVPALPNYNVSQPMRPQYESLWLNTLYLHEDMFVYDELCSIYVVCCVPLEMG
jgi:hypothetical protein